MGYSVHAAGCSSAGKIRSKNEDSFVLHRSLCNPPQEKAEQYMEVRARGVQTYGVFDGMGGELHGDRASFAAAECLARGQTRLRWGNGERALSDMARRMNKAVLQAVEDGRGGCTMAVALIKGKTLFTAHAGDSRIYLFRNGTLTRLTRDHTHTVPGNKMQCIPHCRQNKTPYRSHILLRYLGDSFRMDDLCETAHLLLTSRDRIILCTDGLTDMVEDTRILRRLLENDDCRYVARRLVEDALEAGGLDNATAVVCDLSR